LRIGIAFDLAPAAEQRPASGPDDTFEEFDKPETIEAIAEILRGEGHVVSLLGDGRAFLERVLADPPELVWNMAEGEGVGRCRESRVPAVLEMLGIPCTGSDPLTLAASLDKGLAKQIVATKGVVVPRGLTLDPNFHDSPGRISATVSEFAGEVAFPWIIKPSFEGSSKGIRPRCVVDDERGANEVAGELIAAYRQPILVEEFVAGSEVTVGLTGGPLDASVIGEMKISPRNREIPFVYSLDAKREWQDGIEYEAPALLSDRVRIDLRAAALGSYLALGCRDVARIDFRVRDGIPYFLEANPLPGLAPDWSDLVILARGYGLSHRDLILRILDAALTRVGDSNRVPGP
jgi:D-alanine-D-alanine ligase